MLIRKASIRKIMIRKTKLVRKCIPGLLLVTALSAGAQLTPSKPSTGNFFHRPTTPTQVQGPSRVDEFIVDGKLRLSLENAVLLTLLNNSDLSVNRAQFDLSQFAVQRAHSPFDPLFVAGFVPTRSVSPGSTATRAVPARLPMSRSTPAPTFT